MRKLRVFDSLIRLALVSFMLMCAGCQTGPGVNPSPKLARRPHKLGQVCQANQTADLINVGVDTTAQVLTDPTDSVIFVCEDDQITWYTSNTSTKIKITVTIKSDHPKELFKSHDTTVVWDPDHPGTGPANQTPVETVDKPQNYIFLHKYSIDVWDIGADKHYTLDPHVIPMGKG